jgi:hypothetical protein
MNDKRGLPVRAFISIEKAIKPAVELRMEFHPARETFAGYGYECPAGQTPFIVHR